jgi:hypothetical protein
VKYKLYTDLALGRDLPEEGLRKGDVVRLVDHHVAPDGTEGYSIEVFNTLGDTIAVTAVEAEALEPLRSDEVFSVRSLGAAA